MMFINKLLVRETGRNCFSRTRQIDICLTFFVIILDILIVSKTILRANATGIHCFLAFLVQNWRNHNHHKQAEIAFIYCAIKHLSRYSGIPVQVDTGL
jgi:hypothetical protein